MRMIIIREKTRISEKGDILGALGIFCKRRRAVDVVISDGLVPSTEVVLYNIKNISGNGSGLKIIGVGYQYQLALARIKDFGVNAANTGQFDIGLKNGGYIYFVDKF